MTDTGCVNFTIAEVDTFRNFTIDSDTESAGSEWEESLWDNDGHAANTNNDNTDPREQQDETTFCCKFHTSNGQPTTKGMYLLCKQGDSTIEQFPNGLYDLHYCKWPSNQDKEHYAIVFTNGSQRWRLHVTTLKPQDKDTTRRRYKLLAGEGPVLFTPGWSSQERNILLLEPHDIPENCNAVMSLRRSYPITLSYLVHIANREFQSGITITTCAEFADQWWDCLMTDLSCEHYMLLHNQGKLIQDVQTNHRNGNKGGSTTHQLGLEADNQEGVGSGDDVFVTSFEVPWARSSAANEALQIHQTLNNTYEINTYSHHYGPLKGLYLDKESMFASFMATNYFIHFVEWPAKRNICPMGHFGLLLTSEHQQWMIHTTRLRSGVAYLCDGSNESIVPTRNDRTYAIVVELLSKDLALNHGRIRKTIDKKIFVTLDMLKHLTFCTRNIVSGELKLRDSQLFSNLWFNHLLEGQENTRINEYQWSVTLDRLSKYYNMTH